VVLLAWWLWHLQMSPTTWHLGHGAALGLGAAWLGGLALRLRRAAQVNLQLQFSAGQWQCAPLPALQHGAPHGAAGHLDLMLDGGDALLLRWRPVAGDRWTSRSQWLAVSRRGLGDAAWHGLRVALQWAQPAVERLDEVPT